MRFFPLKVFYRSGIRAVMAPHEKDYAMGLEWVEMTGLMSSVSVGPDDQVWAIGLDDHLVYFRTGVTKDDPGGKMWKSIILPIMPKINFRYGVACDHLARRLAQDGHGAIESGSGSLDY